MAGNYLAIQGSSVLCEREFSSAGLIDTKRRNRLSPNTFSAIEFAKAYHRQQKEDAKGENPTPESGTSHSLKCARENSDIDSDLEGPTEKRTHPEEYYWQKEGIFMFIDNLYMYLPVLAIKLS